jgi:hypothetical protein
VANIMSSLIDYCSILLLAKTCFLTQQLACLPIHIIFANSHIRVCGRRRLASSLEYIKRLSAKIKEWGELSFVLTLDIVCHNPVWLLDSLDNASLYRQGWYL